ncbi:fatty acid desaturase [Bernardetia litoralis DSM 6794]|uniref:Fatty acid desaturase n=1 Tax=Bernardetia litoralis (strain ATCC 23117 / DSM 6794 / NBRC 15988 / NCIMB 1366 / Fx l1 / Sio-4) TaxID=880071 RepID=I4AKQ6_BERLS|nr:fatty acid desaturase [Bernardetia litoralis]AFM04541.1 fatty acid desaturase [Bernardetia litoralis DSM 6794]
MNQKGTYIGITVITLWLFSLGFLLSVYEINWYNPLTYLFFLIQTHLYTGIFITAHDAMHHTVSKNTKVNNIIGTIATGLFAFNYYPRLLKKHHEHHRFVATDKDPDFHHGNFWVWYFNFAKNYITIIQIILMAITYNILKLIFPLENVIFYWMIPSVVATCQLFYFGTYLPHRHAPDNKHHSRSQAKNHVWAFISCYFFGYHYEHHDSPNTPWWRLYQKR